MAVYERMTIKGRGGALPTYQRKTGAYAPGAGVSARVDDSAARIASAGDDLEARALVRLGGTMNAATQIGAKAYDDYSKAKAEQAAEFVMKDMNAAMYGENGFMNRRGVDAAMIPKDFDAALAGSEEAVVKNMELNAHSQRYLKEFVRGYSLRTKPTVERYSATQTRDAFIRQEQAMAMQFQENALLNRDNPELYLQNIRDGAASVVAALSKTGASKEEKMVAQQEYISGAFYAMAKADLDAGKTDTAEKFLNEGRFNGTHRAAIEGQIRDTRLANMRLAISIDAYNDRVAERRRKQLSDEAEKAMTDRFTAGNLSVSDVRSARSILTPEEYRKWTERAVRGWEPATHDDRRTYIELTDLSLAGEDVTAEARQAYLDGRITQTTYNELTTKERDAQVDELTKYISNALKPSLLNPREGQAESYANAMDEWNQWTRRHKDATYQEKRDMAQSIARRYSFIDRNSMTMTMPMPRYFEGSRSDINRATLQATDIQTQAAYDSGKLSEEEYTEQCLIINNLFDVLDRLDQAGAGQSTQSGNQKKQHNWLGIE